MVPVAALPPGTPLTDQVTAVFVEFLADAVNCFDAFTATLVMAGDTVIRTAVCLD
jgi:hypothetical protein